MNKPSLKAIHAVLITAMIATIIAALSVGSGDLSNIVYGDIYLSLRATRLAAASLAGAGLAVSGVLVQGLFRNPLASPSILGTTAGAILGGQISLLVFELALSASLASSVPPEMILPFGCMAGALASLLVLLSLLRGRHSLFVVLLIGFILSSLFLSLGSFVMAMAQESWEIGRAVVAFSLGTVIGASRAAVLFAAPFILVGTLAAFGWGRALDVLLSGEEEAATLGVDVQRVRIWVAVWVSVLVGAAVSVGGSIGFVGLVVPHALRPFTGVHHRRLLPAAALLGAIFVVACDVITRVVPSRSPVPLGVVTGVVGAPTFLYLLLRTHRGVDRV
jgi:iron complex transport system permease protein